jgi:hypothetical protein
MVSSEYKGRYGVSPVAVEFQHRAMWRFLVENAT